MSATREDAPWRWKTLKRWSPFSGDQPPITIVYNRHGDEMATCLWEPDAAFIVELVNAASSENGGTE
jgi:hypothetical protein